MYYPALLHVVDESIISAPPVLKPSVLASLEPSVLHLDWDLQG
jgi:hypothetical protein